MVLVLTACFEIELINPPVDEVLIEGQDAHFIHQVELPCPVKVEDGVEALGMTIEKVLVVSEVVVVTEDGDLFVARRGIELPKTRMREAIERFPHDFVGDTANVEKDARGCMGLVEREIICREREWGQGCRGPRIWG